MMKQRWKPIDFEGIISLDKPVYDQLNQYLTEKEGALADHIVRSTPLFNQIPRKDIHRMKLNEAIDLFEKRVKQSTLSKEPPLSAKELQKVIDTIQNSLWGYVEALEGCVTELFQQIDQVGLEKWHKEMSSIVNSIKVLLMNKLNEALDTYKKLEKQLWDYKLICQKDNIWSQIQSKLPWRYLLTPQIKANIEKSKKYLIFKHKKFVDCFKDYQKSQDKIEHSLKKFDHYQVFGILDSSDQDSFKQLYSLIKLWEHSKATKTLPEQDVVRAIRKLSSEESIYQVFNDYYSALKSTLYFQSRGLKQGPKELWENAHGKTLSLELLSGYRNEVSTLGVIVQKYRDFLLRTDDNPYVRSRLGFSEWVAGPEPTQSKRLHNMTLEVEYLNDLFERLQESVKKGPSQADALELMHASIQTSGWLHEMSQPLISKSIMFGYVDKIVNELTRLNELGSFNPSVVDFVGQILSKALRLDWKYNVLFDTSKFKELYHIHKELITEVKNRPHINRLNKIKHIIKEIKEWSKKRTTQAHIHEIEQDMSDIKILLQDFLSSVQRSLSQFQGENEDLNAKEEYKKQIFQQLLDYRYYFSHFFHELSKDNSDDNMISNQFIFVYQYLEAIEDKLHD